MSEHDTTDYSRHHHSTEIEATGRAGELEPGFPDPGLPEHVYRRTDTDPRAAKKAELQVAGLFLLSMLGAVLFVVAYFAVPLEDLADVGTSNRLLGLGLALALFCIGAGAIHWAKKLMPDDEVAEERHPIRSTDAERAGAGDTFRDGGAAAGFGRRKMIWGSLIGALGAVTVAPFVTVWDFWWREKGPGKSPPEQLSQTPWQAGMRLITDPQGEPIRAADVPIGAVVHVLPQVEPHDEAAAGEGAEGAGAEAGAETEPHGGLSLTEIAKAAVLLVRLEPDELRLSPERMAWTHNGLVAYSKICTHVGCPVGLYEQTTHHLLCPCHQSTFDVARGAEVVFGPAGRPLPQLAIGVDPEGYLIATSDFTEPVGPSFWERG